jgi:branched-chain amino acid transport system ATP-binding protein
MSENNVLLRTEDLTKKFGGLLALSGVDVTIPEGEIVGLIGPNGSGKTTLFNCICGFHHPDNGRVILRSEEITSLQPHQVARKGISRTFQLARLFFDLSVLDNILVAKHLTSQTGFVSSLLASKKFREEEVRFAQHAEDLLHLVDLIDIKDRRARDLPYGSQRLLTLAIALSSDPDLVLLDEPTAGMNQEEAKMLGNILRRINERGVTIFLVEHNMKFVMGLSTRLVVLNFGRVICRGTPDEVRNDEAVIDAYLGGSL